MAVLRFVLGSFLAAILAVSVSSFVVVSPRQSCSTRLEASRRDWLVTAAAAAASAAVLATTAPQPALAAAAAAAASNKRKTLDECIYNIMRVREATFQESRLINSGKFKDVQRANVKLAVKFILNNYRLSDTFIAAAAYLDNNSQRVAAGEVGQGAVQDLQTILEYFDSSDVQNIKVGASDSGKERLVLQGLDSTRNNIDGFLSYFPEQKVQEAKKKILAENELNYKEWDPALGDIVNLPPAI